MITKTNSQRYYIKHPTFGWFIGRKEVKDVNVGSNTMTEIFSKNRDEAPTFTLADLRVSMNASGHGLLALLVMGYTGLQLEPTDNLEKH